MASPSSSKPQAKHLQALSLPLLARMKIKLIILVTNLARRKDGTINRRFCKFFDLHASSNPTPRNGVSTHDIVVDPSKNLSFRLFVPSPSPTTRSGTQERTPVIVYFHGGGFAFLSAFSFSYDAVCRRFARKLNAVVCSVEYRLAPEHKFPSQYDDGFDVLAFLDGKRDQIKSWPEFADVSRCFIAGDSAGGNLSHHVTVRASQTQFTSLRIIGLISMQPFFGGSECLKSETQLKGAPLLRLSSSRWLWRAFLPEGADRDHWAVNVSGPNAVDISGLDFPPTLLFVGGFDPLQDWQRRYYEWLMRSGKEVKLVEYPKAIHGFSAFPELPESKLLFDEVKGFVEKQCKMEKQ